MPAVRRRRARASVPVLVTLLLAVASAACGGRTGGAPDGLEALLPLVPAAVTSERVLYYTDLEAQVGGAGSRDQAEAGGVVAGDGAGGFGSVLPLRGLSQMFAVDPGSLTSVLESGGSPLTLFAGQVDPLAVADAAESHGYVPVAAGEGWRQLRRPADVPSAAAPLVAAVPAVAARDGLLVLGSEADVASVVAGTPPPVWGVPLVRSLGEAVAVALDGRERPFAEASRRGATDLAGLLSQHGVSTPLAGYQAVALTWHPEGRFDGSPEATGVVALALGPGTEGHDQAAALALRAATAPVLGDGRRHTADLIEGGAPRFDPDLQVVRLPVRWKSFDARALRADLEAGRLLFLAPG